MNLVEFYEAVGGDYEDMHARLSKEESIKKYLKKFCDDAEYIGMMEGYEVKDYTKVFKCSHSLKGVCANLCLTSLKEKISDICECVRGGEPKADMTDMIADAKVCYEYVIAKIGELE